MEVWNDADVFRDRALQGKWFKHLKESDCAFQKEQEKVQAELKHQLSTKTLQEARMGAGD